MGEVGLLPHEQNWIIANEGTWSVPMMSKMSGIPIQTITEYLHCVGRENCKGIRKRKKLVPITCSEALKKGWLRLQRKPNITKLWDKHTIAEIADKLGMVFGAVVFEGRRCGLPFTDEKKEEIAEREAILKANRFKNYVPVQSQPRAEQVIPRRYGYDAVRSGAMCNGKYI